MPRWTSLLFAILALGPLIATADYSGMFAPERIGRWYIGGGLGGFNEESNSQLQNPDEQFGTFFSGGYRLSRNIALEIDALLSHQEFDTPPAGINGRKSDFYTNGVGGVAKFILPLDRAELYAGGGIGIYTSTVQLDGNNFEDDEDDTNFGYQLLLGADFFVSRHFSIGVEYRHFKLDANFDTNLLPGKIDAGGDFLFATFRGYF